MSFALLLRRHADIQCDAQSFIVAFDHSIIANFLTGILLKRSDESLCVRFVKNGGRELTLKSFSESLSKKCEMGYSAVESS